MHGGETGPAMVALNYNFSTQKAEAEDCRGQIWVT